MTKPPAPLSTGRFRTATEDPRYVESANRLSRVLKELPWFETRRVPIRSTGVRLLRECARKFMFRCRMGIIPKVQKSFALRVGTLYHAMMAAAVLEGAPDQALRTASRFLANEQAEWKALADDQMLMPDGTSLENMIADSERAFALAQVMFDISVLPFIAKMLDGWTVLAVEQPIEAEVDGISAVVRCVPDAILSRPKDDSLMIVDHKTHSGKTQARAAISTFETQPRIERLCVAAAYPDSTPAFFTHNIIRKTGLRFPAKKYPTYDAYLTAVRKNYEEQQTTDPENPPLLQSCQALVGPVLNEELRVILTEASAACQALLDPARYYRNEQMCMGRYGNSACPYLCLCKTGCNQWADIIKLRFTQRFREDEEDEESTT